MTPCVTTLTPDPRDTDATIALTAAEQADELAMFWRSASHAERVRWWRDADDDERDFLRDALGVKATWAAVDAVVAAGVEWEAFAAGRWKAKVETEPVAPVAFIHRQAS